ncbi:hypothetical protein GCM10023263_92100 [Phytohabitans rumicis]
MSHLCLPDPRDRSLAWWKDEPACLAWWRAVTDTEAPTGLPYAVDLARLYSYSVPTPEALIALRELGPLIELGAGAGYWARLLRDLGVDLVAYDIEEPSTNSWIADAPAWTKVEVGDEHSLAGHSGRTLFVSWPERPSGFMSTVLDVYPPATLVLITDGRVSVGADPLYDRLASGWEQDMAMDIPRWPGRYDSLMIWHRTDSRHPRTTPPSASRIAISGSGSETK